MSTDSIFPHPDHANEEGLLAIGGDLSEAILLDAYSHGIFPWYSAGSPILWWSPDPRLVLYPSAFRLSKSLKQKIKRRIFEVRVDTCFDEVITKCAAIKRKDQPGTWIIPEMKEAYCKLHSRGYAHSFETYFENRLVGGLYGVSIGKIFFGESMFYTMTDASKVALYYLVETLKSWEFLLIDAQQSTSHMISLGAKEVPRNIFLKQLIQALSFPTLKRKWKI
jgi:leucyl/phenylalanyl-tRNA---protein transferase